MGDREKPDNQNDLKLFFFTLKNLTPKSQFLVCCLFIFIFYLIYGYLQELIFTLEGISGWYLTLVQFFYYTLFGLFENATRKRTIPMKVYALLAFLTLGTMVSNLN